MRFAPYLSLVLVLGIACGSDSKSESDAGDGDGDGGPRDASPDAPVADCTPSVGTGLDTELVTDQVIAPVLITHAGDERLFIVEQVGRIRVVENGTLLPTPFLDLSQTGENRVLFAGDERGLLGLAFHPDYQQNGRFFVHYSDRLVGNGDTRIAEYTVSADANVANTTEREVLTRVQPRGNHNGGMIEFGPDGMLYIGLGDGGGSFDPDDDGQNTNTMLGALLRIDVADDSQDGYVSPPDNPFAQGGGRPEIWSYGWRNPWRFSFDPDSGDIWVGDVGQNCLEEVSVQPAGMGGLNFGWAVKEATECRPANAQAGCSFPIMCGDTSGMVEPVIEYPHNGNAASITGGYVYRGGCIPDIDGWYLFADYELSQFYAIDTADQTPTRMDVAIAGIGQPTSFGRDVFGELYIATVGGNGGIYRIVGQ